MTKLSKVKKMLNVNVDFQDGVSDSFVVENFYADRYVWSFQFHKQKTVSYGRGDIKTVTVQHEQ